MLRSLLFDAGGSPDGLVHNLDCLELNPRDWNCIVLSHGHWDHTLGLIGLHRRLGRLNFPVILHPDAYLKRAVVESTGEVSRLPPPSRQALRDAGLELIESERPSFVVESMALVTGQVARTNKVETGWPAHHAERDGVLGPDPLICDDQGLVINFRDKGLVVLSGCGHAGIVNTVQYAPAITGIQRVHAVIGGFHLGPTFFHDRIDWVVRTLVALESVVTAPAHCTGIGQHMLPTTCDRTHSSKIPSAPELLMVPGDRRTPSRAAHESGRVAEVAAREPAQRAPGGAAEDDALPARDAPALRSHKRTTGTETEIPLSSMVLKGKRSLKG
jgi:7,8-dihydropterin-6-yl-methyl-4-(beta-D-ribofuranosyl)aminobenzene 5'-phosphate synthase